MTAAGPLAVYFLRQLSGVQIPNPLATLRVDTSGHDLLVGAGQMFLILMMQYAGYFLLAAPLGWWFRRTGPAGYGLTKGGLSWSKLALAGLAAAALCAWPILAFNLANPTPGGETVAWRQALFTMPMTWQAWVFTGVMSWALVPLLEELFFRGYCLRRLEEEWGTGPAIVGSACLFTFRHSQYLFLNGYNATILICILTFAVGLGIAFALTRSIIPGLAAHVLINFPIRGLWLQGLVAAAAILLSILLAPRALRWTRQAFAGTRFWAAAALGLAAVFFCLVMARDEMWPALGLAALLLVAVGLQLWDRWAAAAKPKFA